MILEMGFSAPLLWILWTAALLVYGWRVVRRLRSTRFFPIGFAILWYAFLLLYPFTYGGLAPYQNFVDNAYLWLTVGILFKLPALYAANPSGAEPPAAVAAPPGWCRARRLPESDAFPMAGWRIMTTGARKPRLAVVSPSLDKRHGTERLVVEWISRLAPAFEIHIYSQAVADMDLSLATWHRIPKIPGPHILNYLWWFTANRLWRAWDSHFRNLRHDLVYSPGINCLDADVMSVHIVFAQYVQGVQAELACPAIRPRLAAYPSSPAVLLASSWRSSAAATLLPALRYS